MVMYKLEDMDLRGKRVLIRQDLNVPVKNGVVTSDQRVTASLDTLRFAIAAGARVMVDVSSGEAKGRLP